MPKLLLIESSNEVCSVALSISECIIQEKWINSVPGAKGQDHEQFENANHFIQDDIGAIMADRVHKFIVKNPL